MGRRLDRPIRPRKTAKASDGRSWEDRPPFKEHMSVVLRRKDVKLKCNTVKHQDIRTNGAEYHQVEVALVAHQIAEHGGLADV